jgi:hypothetical protein
MQKLLENNKAILQNQYKKKEERKAIHWFILKDSNL